MYFNSIKVRLELHQSVGSIKLNKFQFHKGAIRTGFDSDIIAALANFNSIKVRLEHDFFIFLYVL